MFHGKHTFLPLTAALAAAAFLLTACGGTGGTTSAPAASSGAASSAPAASGSAPAAADTGAQAQTAPRFSFLLQTDNTEDGTEEQALYSTTLYALDGATGEAQDITSCQSHIYHAPVCWWEADSPRVYYAGTLDPDAENNDHLYAYDIETDKTETLVDDMTYGIDYIARLDDHQLYLTAGTGGGAIAPVSYDLDKGELTPWEWDPDMVIAHSAQDPKTGTVYVSAASHREEVEQMKQLNDGKIEAYGQSCTVYAMAPEGTSKAVYTSKDWYIDSFAVNGSKIVTEQTRISLNDPTKHRTVVYDMDTDTETTLFEDKTDFGSIVYLSDDGKTLYVNNGDLVSVDVATGRETTLYHPEGDASAVLRDVTVLT